MSKPLSKEQRRQLKSRCHQLQPVVMIASDGLTDNIRSAISEALLAHELIKIRIRADRQQREDISKQILQATGAVRIMSIGQILCIYQPHPQQPRLLS